MADTVVNIEVILVRNDRFLTIVRSADDGQEAAVGSAFPVESLTRELPTPTQSKPPRNGS